MDGSIGLMNAAIALFAVSLLLDLLRAWRSDVSEGIWITLLLGNATLAAAVCLLPAISRIGAVCLCGFLIVATHLWWRRRRDVDAGMPWSSRIGAAILLFLLLVAATGLQAPSNTPTLVLPAKGQKAGTM
jgi:hypothetical protein